MRINGGSVSGSTTLNVPKPKKSDTSNPTVTPTSTPLNTSSNKKVKSTDQYKQQDMSLLQRILTGITNRPSVDSYAIFNAAAGFASPKYVYNGVGGANDMLVPRYTSQGGNGGFVNPQLLGGGGLVANPFLELNEGGGGQVYYLPYYSGGGGGGGSYNVPRWMLNDIYWRTQ